MTAGWQVSKAFIPDGEFRISEGWGTPAVLAHPPTGMIETRRTRFPQDRPD
jgi:hypothetical protein